MSNIRNFIIEFAAEWANIARYAIVTNDYDGASERRLNSLKLLDDKLKEMAVPTPEVNVEVLTREATDIAKYLQRELYPDVPQWQPFDYLAGLMSQIDNMVCGIPDMKARYEAEILRLENRKPLADEMIKQMKERCDSMEMRGAFVDGWLSAEAAHGIGEKK